MSIIPQTGEHYRIMVCS